MKKNQNWPAGQSTTEEQPDKVLEFDLSTEAGCNSFALVTNGFQQAGTQWRIEQHGVNVKVFLA